MRREVNNVDELRAIVGEPDQYVANKVKDRLSPIQHDWLAHSPLGFVATTDADGRVDVSPKGDPPGFVHVIDDTTIAIPERPGNRRVDGHLNVLERPHVGTLFLIPGRGDTLRINGTARILSDAWDPSTWNPTAIPSVAQIAKAIRYDWTQAELDARYSEANMRKVLY